MWNANPIQMAVGAILMLSGYALLNHDVENPSVLAIVDLALGAWVFVTGFNYEPPTGV
jgi:hypothetical protein